MNRNLQICNADTDSISFCKSDLSPLTPEDRKNLVKEINDLSPEFMQWEDDGYYRFLICLKSKNYVLQTFDGKVKTKGSALKDQKKEPALLEFLQEIIKSILEEKYNYQEIYQKYINEVLNLQDIKRWAQKRTITEAVYKSKRKNETKVLDSIKNYEYREGDKVYLYPTINDELKLVEKYSKDHDIIKLLQRLFDTSVVFMGKTKKDIGIIPKGTFINWSLVKNYKQLMGGK